MKTRDQRAKAGTELSRRRVPASELIHQATRSGADDALSSLINQFSDALSFLREVVQNSLDAASSRIDVEYAFQPEPAGEKKKHKKKGHKKRKKRASPRGLMTITVADNGEGMNESIIDNYLLTLFRSTKEQDLTKIGKFGVGFVSIFAIEPQLVVLDTGQAGESWRLIFHADASYEKLRLEEPIEGTTISLHKQVTQSEYESLRDRGEQTVRYWCKFADAEIFFDGQSITEPFGIDSQLGVSFKEPGTEMVVGFAPLEEPQLPPDDLTETQEGSSIPLRSLIGFYNRGLTLMESEAFPKNRDDALELTGLSMRIKSRYLEHTLTRDNVLQNEDFDKAMALIHRQVEGPLRQKLIDHMECLALAASDSEPPLAQKTAENTPSDLGRVKGFDNREGHTPKEPAMEACLVYAGLPSMRLHKTAPRACLFATIHGEPVSFHALERQKMVLYAAEKNPVTDLLHQRARVVLRKRRYLKKYLNSCGLKVKAANEIYYTAVKTSNGDLAEDPWTSLLERIRMLLDHAKARVNKVQVGDLEYPQSLKKGALYIRQEEAFGLTRVSLEDQPKLFGGAREVVLNIGHPLVHSAKALAKSDAPLAALLLAQGICLGEGIERELTSTLIKTTLEWARSGEIG